MAGEQAIVRLIVKSKKGGMKMAKVFTATNRKDWWRGCGRERGIVAVLKRAARESEFLARLAEDPHEALKEYYSLTTEEVAALASGDIRKIESWVGKLDENWLPGCGAGCPRKNGE
jgi:hypothetical protein